MYSIKIYQKDGTTLIKTLEIEKLESISSFSSQINGGYGNLKLSVAYQIDNTTISEGNIIKVQYLQQLIYTGSVLDITHLYGKTDEIMELNLIGYGSMLSNSLTNSTYSDIASNIVKDLIDEFNIKYGDTLLTYDSTSIPDTTTTLDFDFSDYVTFLSAITEVSDTTGLYFFIDLDGKVYFKARSEYNKHTLTAKLDIDELSINTDLSNVINSLYVENTANTKNYEDTASQTLYGKREIYIDKSSTLNEITADEFGASYIAQYKDPIKKISLSLNNSYNYYDIKGGDLITVKNLKVVIAELQVAKITYAIETATLELELIDTLASEIFNNQ